MRLFKIVVATFILSGTGSAAEAERAQVTPAPLPPGEGLNRGRVPAQKRQTSSDILSMILDGEFCNGDLNSQDAICDIAYDLQEQCQGDINNPDKFDQCLCGNGGVEVQQQCDWCLEGFGFDLGINYTFNEILLTSACLQNSDSIAPIPASVLAIESSYNATYTGGFPTNTGTGAVVTQTGSSSVGTLTAESNSASNFTTTLFGGGGGSGTTPTSNAGPQSTTPTSTGEATASTANSWRVGDAALFFLMTLGVIILFLT